MKYLWLLYLPLLYLPNMGFVKATRFGTFEISDYLIGPYIVLLLFSIRKRIGVQVDHIVPVLLIFIWWASLSTLLINFRYGYDDSYFIIFGLLKLFKMALYGFAGIFTIKALNQMQKKMWYNWSLLACGLIVAASTFMTIGASGEIRSYQDHIYRQVIGYKAFNSISVMMAMLLCCLAGLWTKKLGSHRWQRAMSFAFVFIVAGFTLSQGRGGWIAAMAGSLYLLYKIRKSPRVFAVICLILAVSFAAYHYFPNFRYQVDITLQIDDNYKNIYQDRILDLDRGGRLRYFLKEAPKIVESPFWGAGFFHRGFPLSKSDLDKVGSHNFWLQMFLETGIVGGVLVLLIFWRMWRQAIFFEKNGYPLSIPVQVALISGFVGGMSGEYFYGGMVLFTLFVVYAPVGGLHAGVRQGRLANRLLFSQ